MLFLMNGHVAAVTEEAWQVAGLDFTLVNDPEADLVTTIDPPTLGEGDPVTIEFTVD